MSLPEEPIQHPPFAAFFEDSYVQVDEYFPELNETFQLWEQTNVGEHQFVLKNIQNGDPWISLDPYRNYWGTRIGYDWYQQGDPDYWASTEGHELYGFVRPRRARLGIRFMF